MKTAPNLLDRGEICRRGSLDRCTKCDQELTYTAHYQVGRDSMNVLVCPNDHVNAVEDRE